MVKSIVVSCMYINVYPTSIARFFLLKFTYFIVQNKYYKFKDIST